jgi:hypothetical protein
MGQFANVLMGGDVQMCKCADVQIENILHPASVIAFYRKSCSGLFKN